MGRSCLTRVAAIARPKDSVGGGNDRLLSSSQFLLKGNCMMMEEIDLIYSKHCQTVSRDGKTVKVEIYGSGKNDWILEVVDEDGNSTVWDDPLLLTT